MEPEQLTVPTDLEGIYLAIGGVLAPGRKLTHQQFDLSGQDAEGVFRRTFEQLANWGRTYGVDVETIVRGIPART